jgi:hypothetical protein
VPREALGIGQARVQDVTDFRGDREKLVAAVESLAPPCDHDVVVAM